MGTDVHARRAPEEMDLTEGLSAKEVQLRLARLNRLGDLGQRGLAFYLLEMEERGLHQQWGHASTLGYAEARLDMSPRRTRELLWAGKKLRELPEIDRAFCGHEISWTKVIVLLRVASPEHEGAWAEKAKALSCRELKRAVVLAREGGPPREPGDAKGLPEIRFRESVSLGVIPHKKLEVAKEKLSAELGRAVTTADLLDVALGIYLDSENDGSAPGWTHVPSSLYRIHLRPWMENGSTDMPLLVETEDGLLPIDGSRVDDVIARQRTACACCDGEVVPDCDAETEHDVPTPPRLRKRVLVRDGHRCRCCGAKGELHVHHIVFRTNGGRTKVWNLITLCVRCHSMIHEGLLVIQGERQRKARFLDSEGRSIHEPGRTVDPSVLLQIQAPERDPMRLDAGEPEEAWVTLDDIPKEVDGAWWQAHADSIRDRGAKGLELRPGRPSLEPREPTEDEPPPGRRSFEDAFAGIVGQSLLLERLQIETEGGRELGEAFPHTLFSGPPGTGKTTLARGIAASVGKRLLAATGPTLQDVHGLLCLLASLKEGDMLFLDEAHATPKPVLETLYEAMAERRVSLRFHAGSRTRTVRLELPAFTLLAATTEPSELPRPLKTRFALREHLDFYDAVDLAALATARAEAKGFELGAEAARVVADFSRGTPRELLRLLDRVLRFAAAEGQRGVEEGHALEALVIMGYDMSGLSREDQKVLEELRESRVPIPGRRLAQVTGIDLETMLEEIEPWLCRWGLMRVTPRGRVASPRLLDVEERAPAMEAAY